LFFSVRMCRPTVVFSLSAVIVLAAACDNGTTVASIPVLEASVMDAGTFMLLDAGIDAPGRTDSGTLADGASDGARDARLDVTTAKDARTDGTTHADAGADARRDGAGGGVHDAAHDAARDATHDATHDAGGTRDAAPLDAGRPDSGDAATG
jgi:hypothetical protein